MNEFQVTDTPTLFGRPLWFLGTKRTIMMDKSNVASYIMERAVEYGACRLSSEELGIKNCSLVAREGKRITGQRILGAQLLWNGLGMRGHTLLQRVLGIRVTMSVDEDVQKGRFILWEWLTDAEWEERMITAIPEGS